MINTDALFIVNYRHANCVPLKNIMRLPKEEAFALACQMAADNKNTTAFGRFADFENYYPRRLAADRALRDSFIEIGGDPKTEHPLSFVFHGSEYLDQWFDHGPIARIAIKEIPSESISFTYGDSMRVLEKNSAVTVRTKEMLLRILREYEGTLEDFMSEIVEKCRYIEVQLWDDQYALSMPEPNVQ